MRLEQYPEKVCLSNAGTIAMCMRPAEPHEQGSVRVLAPNGTLLAEHAFDELAPDDGRTLWLVDVVDLPEQHAFCVLIDAEDQRYLMPEWLRKEAAGALVLLDQVSGDVVRPPATWGRRGSPRKLVAVKDTQWLAVECDADEGPYRNEWVFLDAGPKVLGILPGKVLGEDLLIDRLLDSPASHEIRVRFPGARDLQHYTLDLEDGSLRIEKGVLETVPPWPATPTCRLDEVDVSRLALPKEFVDVVIRSGMRIETYSSVDEKGRILLQDWNTGALHALDPRGDEVCSLRLAERGEWCPSIRALRVGEDGSFVVCIGNRVREFAADGRFVGLERKQDGGIAEGGEMFWSAYPGGVRHEGADSRADVVIQRHADRRFFTQVGGVLCERDRLVVLDNTHWKRRDRIWHGRISTYSLDRAVQSTRELVLSPGQEDVKLIAACPGWLLLEGQTVDRGIVVKSNWLVPRNGDGARELRLDEPGRPVGFSQDGGALYVFDVEARYLRTYALPQR